MHGNRIAIEHYRTSKVRVRVRDRVSGSDQFSIRSNHGACDNYSRPVERRCGYMCLRHGSQLQPGPINEGLCSTPLHSTPQLGGRSRSIAIKFGTQKLEWFGYPTVKKSEDMSTRFDRMYEGDRRTDTQTPQDG